MQNVHWNCRKLGIYSYQKHVLIVIVATVNSPFFYGLLCPFKMFSRIHNTTPNPHLQNPHMHAHTHACTYTHIYIWPMEINWYYISVWIANSVNYFFFFVRKQLELFMYSYFQAYQAEWLYKNYFLFSSREQSKAIMGLTSEKEYVSWCFCCQWFMNTVHLICHACVDSVQLGYVLLARTLCLGEITFAGLSFPQETELCGCWLAGEMRAFLTDRRDGRNLSWRSAFIWWSRVPGLAEAVNLGVFSQTLWTRSCKFDIILLLTSIMKLLFWDASVLVTFCVWWPSRGN